MNIIKPSQNKKAFTLIELSLVLVIIGLLVAGVLVGRTLIASAYLRKQGSLIEQMNIGVNLFKGSYDALPGDFAQASNFGLGTNGDGNNAIFSYSIAPYNQANSGPENFNFFQHMISAGLLLDRRGCGTNCNIANANPCAVTFAYQSPMALSETAGTSCGYKGYIALIYTKGLANCSGFTPCYLSYNTTNHYYVFSAGVGNNTDNILTPATLSELDRKFDDGFPTTGSVRAWHIYGNGVQINDDKYVGNGTTLSCMDRTTTPYTYKTNEDATYCPIMWAAPF